MKASNSLLLKSMRAPVALAAIAGLGLSLMGEPSARAQIFPEDGPLNVIGNIDTCGKQEFLTAIDTFALARKTARPNSTEDATKIATLARTLLADAQVRGCSIVDAGDCPTGFTCSTVVESKSRRVVLDKSRVSVLLTPSYSRLKLTTGGGDPGI